MSTYNGWTNYATWRINLEIFDSVIVTEWFPLEDGKPDVSDVARYLEDYVDEVLCTYSSGGPCGEGLTLDYARAFVSQVNWYEIAEHLLSDVDWEEQEEEQEE
jgi:hypothetical protein